MKADLPQMTEGMPDDWTATCGVCIADFAVRKSDSENNPAPHGSFCPDCRQRGLIAPGVLHWNPRSDRRA